MHKDKSIDVVKLFTQRLGKKIEEYNLPPPSFDVMGCEILEFNDEKKYIIVKIPVLESWLNPYNTMQGGLIIGAIDNAVGPLSLLIAPKNLTRNIESKLIKPITMDIKHIYVTASLFEQKKRRLIFEIVVKDRDENVYAKAKIINWIL